MNTTTQQKRFLSKTIAGFTLLETLVAISLLLISVVGPLGLISRSLANAFVAKDRVVASFLAEEGIEYVRSIRDSNMLNETGWLNGVEGPCGGSGCTIDTKSGAISSCPSGGCSPLLFNSSDGFYAYAAGEESRFTRTITIIPGTGAHSHEALIRVEVDWRTGAVNPPPLILEEYISEWI